MSELSEQKQAEAKILMETVSAEFGGVLSDWKRNEHILGMWDFADLTLYGKTVRIGVSDGLVVSFNGRPHDPDGKVNDNLDSVRKSLRFAFRNDLLPAGGPWKLVSDELGKNFAFLSVEGLPVAYPHTAKAPVLAKWDDKKLSPLVLWRSVASREEQERAQVLLSAPVMLAALEKILNEIGPSYGLDPNPSGSLDMIAFIARSAVAAANTLPGADKPSAKSAKPSSGLGM